MSDEEYHLPQDHDHDEEGNCVWVPVNPPEPPSYRLSGYDLAADVIMTVGNLVAGLSNGVQCIALAIKGSTNLFVEDLMAAANYRRAQQHEAQNRRLLADDLASLEKGETP